METHLLPFLNFSFSRGALLSLLSSRRKGFSRTVIREEQNRKKEGKRKEEEGRGRKTAVALQLKPTKKGERGLLILPGEMGEKNRETSQLRPRSSMPSCLFTDRMTGG